MNRREVLLALGGASALLAGCVDGDDAGGESDDPAPDDGEESEPTDASDDGEESDDPASDDTKDEPTDSGEPRVVEASIETLDTSTGAPDEAETSVEIEDDTVVVTGTRQAPNPCHEATLASYGISDAVLSVRVGLESTLDEGEACVDVLGTVQYEAVFRVENAAALADVDVEHVDDPET